MKITICGSMHYKEEMIQASKLLESLGYEVELPNVSESSTYDHTTDDEQTNAKSKFIKDHLDKISTSDAILVFNKAKNGVDNYIGGNSLMEMAFAYSQNLEIFLLNPIPDISYSIELKGMRPIILDGKVETVDIYFQSLPQAFVSSKSPIKLRAVSRALRRSGIRTLVLPRPAESSVSEQPQSIEETYEGASNRHDALAQTVTKDDNPAYLATVESGNSLIHANHNTFSCTVVILEKVGRLRKTGINIELEIPKEMTDKVPSVYPDLGVLVQREYGSTLKDPFPFFTNGKINRLKLVEDALFNVAAQLDE